MRALKKMERLAEAWEARPALIREARDEGATWEQIAAALNMSRAGVIKLHNTQPEASSPLKMTGNMPIAGGGLTFDDGTAYVAGPLTFD